MWNCKHACVFTCVGLVCICMALYRGAVEWLAGKVVLCFPFFLECSFKLHMCRLFLDFLFSAVCFSPYIRVVCTNFSSRPIKYLVSKTSSSTPFTWSCFCVSVLIALRWASPVIVQSLVDSIEMSKSCNSTIILEIPYHLLYRSHVSLD